MARSGQLKPTSTTRMPDVISMGLISKVFPARVLDEVIEAAGRTQRRSRALPARVVAYFAIGMALYSDASYEEVFERLTDGLSWSSGFAEIWSPPSKSAIFQARARLGFEPLRDLFSQAALPLATAETPAAFLAGRRLLAIDGTCLDLADTPANSEYFGRPGSSRGEKAAFPQARVVAIAECGPHAIMEAEIGAYSTSEVALSVPLLGNLVPGTLLLADRGFYSFHRWKQAAGTGADLLWRVKTGLRPTYMESLPDGSWLAEIAPSNAKECREHPPVTVRVIDYSIEDGRESPETYRLLTTLLDPEEVPAQELALAYAQRWEIENAFDEFKTHQRGPRKVLRSKSPQLVLQEIWGHLCCHYAVRSLMSAVAVETGVDPDRVSFIAALNIARRSIAQGDFPPS